MTTERQALPSLWRLFRVWAGIGLQSFGGGASTTLLIQRAFIERTGWITDEEFLRLWNLCLLTPGINLVALTALLGKKLGGARGILVSLAGMLLPSGAITCLLAALFVRVEASNTVQAVLRGVIPATGGVMAVVLVNFARPVVKAARKSGWALGLLSVALTVGCASAVILFNVSAIVIVVGLAVLGALLYAPHGGSGATTDSATSADSAKGATR